MEKTLLNFQVNFNFVFELLACSGESTRRGFYIYDDRRKAKPDPEVKRYIEKARSMSGITIDPKVGLRPSSSYM